MFLVDVGNTRIKSGVVVRGELETLDAFSYRSEDVNVLFDDVWGQLRGHDIVLISQVADQGIKNVLETWFQANWSVMPRYLETMSQQCGITNSYREPAAMGVDRWLAMIAAWALVHDSVCIIDFGTAVTIDVLDSNGQHEGGLILPGLQLMRQSLQQRAANIAAADGCRVELANNTADAVYSGCYTAILSAVNRVVGDKLKQNHDCQCIITGGDAEVFSTGLEFQYQHDAELVLSGMAIVAQD